MCYDNRPSTSNEVDAVVSCKLPAEEGPLRVLVSRHKLHNKCKQRCHKDGDTSHCKNRFPFLFQDETDFDRRGYPSHRRRPCGGGHLYVKFADNVDHFNHLYKCMLKGPDFARHDEISVWQRGRERP